MIPKVDVLIPAYNAAPTIRAAIDSIRGQTLTEIAIHIVDDGSTDGTAAILRDLAEADRRILIHTKANGGIVDALNFGLAHCTAPLLARHDADDHAYADRLAVQAAWMELHPATVAVGAAARHIDAQDQPTGTIARLEPPDRADLSAIPAREPYMIHPFLMVRRTALVDIGGYRYAPHAEDTDLYWRLSAIGQLENLPDVLGDYRMHDASISGRSIVNGRIMSIGSQLAAFSARRRASNRADLRFAKSLLPALQAAGTIDAMAEIAASDMDGAERTAFEEAVAGKLLELTSYRPYELERSDVAFIRAVANRGFSHLPASHRKLQMRRISGAGARLAAAGRVADGLSTVPSSLLPHMLVRWLLRARIFNPLRSAMTRARAAPAK